ncbi:tapasin [Parambassis ranga]|uniref:Tapasin n=1 Tax=Parambassis ranga TaxID=210632 RepID=A0A6P7JGT2_9TELE|nr:tapasin-like [Parambassis ranga]
MGFILKILIYLYLCAGVRCVLQIPWLPCQFTDEQVSVNKEGHTETQHMPREAMLQFGQKGEAPVNPHAITFLITGSKLDLRRYMEGVEADQLECELRRYSTEGIHVRWPVIGAQDYNFWFTCTLRHSKGLFTVTGFLRQPTDQPPPGQQDYRRWSAIGDREILTTSVALVIKTQTPSVRAGLGSQQKLHCQFGVDHKGPNVTVEWHWQYRGDRIKLFSHNSRTGQTQGTGVGVKTLTGGDVSYTLPFAKMSSEGTFICSVSVTPLFTSVDINLRIEEPPRVSLNVGPTVSLQEGGEQKVVCEAEGYFPLDVEIVWTEQDSAASGRRVGAPLPRELKNVLLSSHKHNPDQTYSVAAFFYLQATLRDSGKQFTCSVSHQSLRMPIRKSFILSVEEPSSWMFYLTIGFVLVSLLAVLCVMLCYLQSARKQSAYKIR